MRWLAGGGAALCGCLTVVLAGCGPGVACESVSGACLDLTVEGQGEYAELAVELLGRGGSGVVVAKTGRVAGAQALPMHLELVPAPSLPESDVAYVTVRGSRADTSVERGGIDLSWPTGQHIAARVILGASGPTLDEVQPASGPVAGGIGVDLVGTGFSSDTVVRFGGAAARELTVLSPTRIFVKLPPSPGGAVAVPVSITSADGRGSHWSGSFRYEVPVPPVVQFSSQPLGIKAIDSPTALAVGDFDGDGRSEVFVASYGNATASLLRDDGLGGFAVLGPFAVGSGPRSVAVGDSHAE